MSQNAVIMGFLIGMVSVILFTLAVLFPRKRKVFLALAFFVIIIDAAYLLKERYEEKKIRAEDIYQVEIYLREKYPEERWHIQKKESVSLHSRGIKVVFLNEPDKTYIYIVEDGKIKQMGWSEKEGRNQEGKHYEGEPDQDRLETLLSNFGQMLGSIAYSYRQTVE